MSAAARRAVGIVCVGIVLATACVLLGRWQWNRHVWRDAAIAVVTTNYAADPVPLDDVLASTDETLGKADEWRTVEVVGRYDSDATVLLRNRPVDGHPAYHVLVPFVVSDASAGIADDPTGAGGVLVVDRGWVPTGEDASAAVDVPAPPTGTVTLTARLRLDERETTRTAPPGQVQAVASSQVLAAGRLDAVPYAAYAQRLAEDPAPAQVPGTLPPPSTDPGSHLSYAFQWWAFALLILGGSVVIARREAALPTEAATGDGVSGGEPSTAPPGDGASDDTDRRSVRPGAGAAPAGHAPDRPAPRRRGGRAEDEEDALIDAQLAARGGTDGRDGPVRPAR
ncbi:SURF1-like protein [Cellulomonas algicola]|uniref:SURF1-like protein n=1 Tax=Cellulomonas algicola TaxID=2071633 RepID=A0A401V2F7_9CELL|nr:SURF1 family protein [Cellulomonas algicola]GCD21100.1 SURF1-like protein [Cellulomonas algicola]